jgi:protease-4
MTVPNYATPDYVADRRRLRRKLYFWRAAVLGIVAVGALVLAIAATGGRGPATYAPHIARISIDGLITGDQDTLKLIDDAGKADTVKALILDIDSPGGTTTGAEKIFASIRHAAEKKPVVAVVGTLAASGAYIAAIAADRIVARGNSLVGSIGVLFEYPNFSGLLGKIGVEVETIKSSPLKASPNGLEPTSAEARAAIAALVVDSFDWFKGLVKDRRQLDDGELAKVADGRIFTGRQGVPLKLVDTIGGENDAIAWLETEKHVTKDLPVRDWKVERPFGGLKLFSAAARLIGLGALGDQISRLAQAPLLDGLLVIWQSPGFSRGDPVTQ